MTTQSGSHNADIDRTDELPRLDVEAYEASLAATDATGSRTDTWTMQALRDIDAAAADEQPTKARWQREPGARVTGDVDHILKRVADLESELAAVKTENTQLQARCAELGADGGSVQMVNLKADNARLAEHRTIANEMVARLEQKLRDQSLQATTQLTELQSARFDEHLKAEKMREELQQQIAQKTVHLAALEEDHRKLHEELQAAQELAERRAETIEKLRTALAEEEAEAEQLARQLASKLSDYDALSSILERRDQLIDELRASAGDLGERLQRTLLDSGDLSSELEAANGALRDARTQLAVRDSDMAAKDSKLAQLASEVERLNAELRSAIEQHDNMLQTISEHEQARSVLQQLRDELDTARAKAQALSEERDALLAARDELAAKNSALERDGSTLADTERDLVILRNELLVQTENARRREAELVDAQKIINDMRSERDALNQSLEEAWHTVERLKTNSQAQAQLLQTKTAELSALSNELNEQSPALRGMEHVIRARDELVEELRRQLQTTQDERAIVMGQLEKSRQRVKLLAQQIFQRDNQVAALKADLAVHTEALAAIRRDVNRLDDGPEKPAEIEPQRVLEPVEHSGESIILDRKIITIGRTLENDICMSSKLISRHHARLLVGPTGVIVEDAGSTNGCFVNGRQVRQQLLREGDLLEIGDMKFRLTLRSPSDTRVRNNVVAIRP